MKEAIILLLKGFLVGTAKMIPGVSGSVLAISLGLYEKILLAISRFFDNVKKNIRFLLPLGIGILMAIVLTSKIIAYLILNYLTPTLFLFCGLILGGLPTLCRKINFKTLNLSEIVFLLIPFLGVVIPIFISDFMIDRTTNNFFVIVGLGMIDALATIIPGLSGTALLMMIGYYSFVVTNIGNPSLNNIYILISFGLGFIINIILLVRTMHYLLENHHKKTYLAIIGFTSSSIILVLYKALSVSFTFPVLVISIILLIIGFVVGYYLED